MGGASSIRVVLRAGPSWRGRVRAPTLRAVPVRGGDPLRRAADVDAVDAREAPRAHADSAARLRRPGWYAYRETASADAQHHGVTGACSRFRVEAQPRVRTAVSDRSVRPGTAVFDRVVVRGLAGRGATVEAALYGPFPSRAAVSCDGKPVWTGSIPVAGDGAYRTDAFTPTATGFYTYREWILATGFVRPATTRCGEAAETTVVQAQPEVETVVSAEVVRRRFARRPNSSPRPGADPGDDPGRALRPVRVA